MKSFCCFIAIAICLGITGVAHAAPIDFAMNILDPLTGGVPETTNSFPISFTQCSTFSNASEFPSDITTGATAADYGCFEGVNATAADQDDIRDGHYSPDGDDMGGVTWTSLDMTFGNNSFLAGQAPSCGGIDHSISFFLSTNCSYNSTTQIYSLDFSGGAIAPGESFLIVEYATTASPREFGTGTAFAGTGTVPEPNSALLLGTGTAMFSLLLYAERRRLARQSLRS